MSKRLAALAHQSFSRSLSDEESNVVEAINSPKLHSLSEQEFRELIAQAAVINSIKALPSDIEVTLLQQLTQNTYRTTSIKDWQNAFLLNAVGKEWDRVDAYNLFSISFMADVFKRYEEYKAKTWRELNKALILPEAEPREYTPTNPLDDLHADAERYKNGKQTWVEISAPYNCQRLFRQGIYKKSDWMPEVWDRMDDLAEQRIAQRWKDANKLRNEGTEQDFINAKKIELSRIVYIDIIKQINKGEK
jgi:hypothetical protein